MVPNNVIITQNVEKVLADLFPQLHFSTVGLLADENTEKNCYPLIKDHLPTHQLLSIKSGEQEKTLVTCNKIWEWLTEHEFDRKALLINLGGGVIGDMGGFCAATYKRGIKFINLPTTLLSMADAAIGGKLGVDFKGYKNHIGVFQDPYYIIVSPEFLSSLPERQLRSGFAEVIKHSLIADKAYWPSIYNQTFSEQNWPNHIKHSIEVKYKVVAEDPKEEGLRKILNFGHTIGHALESYFLGTEKELLHGEAIAMGMQCEAFLSTKYCGLPFEQFKQIDDFLNSNFQHPSLENIVVDDIVNLTTQDKKNEGKKIKASLLNNIGDATFDIALSPHDIKEALTYYQQKLTSNKI